VDNLRRCAAGLVISAAGLVSCSDPRFVPAHAPEQKRRFATLRATPAQAAEAFGKLPLRFEPNRGQADPEVKFLARGSGYTLLLTPDAAVLRLRNGPRRAAVRWRLQGALAPRIEAADPLPGAGNYFIGRDPARWRTNIPGYARVWYRGVYPGVDLIYHGRQGTLEYDFAVAPHGNPEAIEIAFEGVEGMFLDREGGLVLRTPAGEIRQQKPLVYQERHGVRRQIPARYVLKGGRRAGFVVGEYDAGRPLLMDPSLSYSTFLGGLGTDRGAAIAVDAFGNAYVAGDTDSPNIPIAGTLQSGTRGDRDAFAVKFNVEGTALVYSTFLGGAGTDLANAIAVDSLGSAYLTGETDSPDFPTTPNAFQTSKQCSACVAFPAPAAFSGFTDAFVARLAPGGQALFFSTYLGGSGNDRGVGIAVDEFHRAYVTGETDSFDFPAVHAMQPAAGGGIDGFVTRLNESGDSLFFSTYLGGEGDDRPAAIALDAARNPYVTGATNSRNFPVVSAAQPANRGGTDAFVSKLSTIGTTLLYSTFIGGADEDQSNDIAVDSTGSAYITGQTRSVDFPTTPQAIQPSMPGNWIGFLSDAFVTKLNPAGNAFAYSTYLGGAGATLGAGIAVDSLGNAYVTGQTDAADFPTTPDAIQRTRPPGFFGPFLDAFVAKLNAAGSALIFSTFLGGRRSNLPVRIAVDALGNAYLTGATDSIDFPVVKAFQPASGGGFDAFVTKIAFSRQTLPPAPGGIVSAAGPGRGPGAVPSAAPR
jgi:hypothetical protein